MKKQYTVDPYGTFVVDDEQLWKVASALAAGRHPQQDELDIFKKFTDANSVFLDIGANIGTITVAMAKTVKKVYAFEPIPDNLALLNENVRLNNLTNVEVHPVALGSKFGKVSMETDSGESGGFSIRGEGDIELVTLDSVHTAPTFMKIDVEGHELEVLKGGRKTIESHKPTIWFEVNLVETRRRGDWWLSGVERELRSLGYEVYLPTKDGFRKVGSIAREMFALAPKAFLLGKLMYSTNFLAVPKGTSLS